MVLFKIFYNTLTHSFHILKRSENALCEEGYFLMPRYLSYTLVV